MKVLALGYLPKWRGGRQTTGLATGIFDLHDAVNELNQGISVTIAATDVFKDNTIIEHTPIVGWTKKLLLIHGIKRFYRLPFFFVMALKIVRQTKLVPFFDTISKLIFLDRAIEKTKPDIIHLHGALYAYFRNALWRNKCPVVLRLHGLNGYDSTIVNYEKYRAIEQEIVKFDFKFVTFVTNDICEDWKNKYGVFSCPMIPINNGYNQNVFFPPKDKVIKQFDLITISGISERKGQDRVIEALKQLKDEGVNLSYLIVGNGDPLYTAKIKSMVKEYDLNVVFMDYCSQDKLNELLWKSKWFIQPSASEGFGKTYVESIAAGTPVILPKHLPIVKEKGLLTSVNSLLTEDESVKSIYNCLKNIKFNNCYDFKIVADSIVPYSWTGLGEKYIAVYRKYCSE